MPELPEVQTIVSDLQKVLPGLKITDVWSDHKKMIKNPSSFSAFKKSIVGKKILKTERRGKNILIFLSPKACPKPCLGQANNILLVHQKMTGHFLYGKYQMTHSTISGQAKNKKQIWIATEAGPLRDDPENRFIHLVFILSNGKHLALCDMRKFAKVALFPTNNPNDIEEIKKLGPEPFGKDFTLKYFSEFLKKKQRPVKILLMDQAFVAGIGNIYADEILWKAGVHPLKKASELSQEEIKNIYQSIKPILKKAVKARGSSYVDYRDAFGRKGKYQEMHYAYQKTGTGCQKKDGGIIEKIKVGGRGTHFCPIHQKQS